MTDGRSIEDDAPRDDADELRAGHPEDDGLGQGGERPSWSNLWQVPTILLSILLIASALLIARSGDDDEPFEPALAQAESLLQQNLLDEVESLLRHRLEPILEEADETQRGRFHQLVADWLVLRQRDSDIDQPDLHQRIVNQYDLAVEHGITLNPARLERLAHSLISLSKIAQAERVLRDLEQFDDGRRGDVYERRGRVFRRIVEHQIAHADETNRDELMRTLTAYREDRKDELDELVWAVARQADLRLRHGDHHVAVEQLMVDLRRIEYRAEQQPGTQIELGELYTLLGRGYHELGEYDQARAALDLAMEQFVSDDPVRGEALVLLGRIAFARGDLEAASDDFDEVVRHFIGTSSYLLGILGLAETKSVLGYHDESHKEYRRLAGMLDQIDQHPHISRQQIARSLIDRHDAALAGRNLSVALAYVRLAEEFFNRPDVPSDVLFRVGATSRQRADDLMAEVEQLLRPTRGETLEVRETDRAQRAIAIRREANRHYQQSGDYFIRHARATAGAPGDDDTWATSLWLGAKAYDRGGLHELTIKHLEEYLAGRSTQDPRRAEVNLLLAQSHHALQQFENAARYYRQVIDEHPRSIEATKSYVPLARSLVAIGRRPEAEQLLAGVVAGLHPIQPDARDYRDALIELGSISYHGGNYRNAIERLDEAIQRYPDDPRFIDLKFKLGDSYRRLALSIMDRIREPSAESPGERRRLDDLRIEHLTRAQQLFDRVCDAYSRRDQRTLDRMQRESLRQAYLYRADCAYHLGRYEQAIQLYDQAARRYADHHSSMHALVQIVNAYMALGDVDRAEAAHRRALSRLQQLRDEAFQTPDAIMDRQAWERWLEHSPVGSRQITRADG